jgi:A/G-specific adenine glycosylase
VREVAVIVRKGNRILLRKHLPGERWAGLWDFIRFPITSEVNGDVSNEIERNVFEQTGIRVQPGKHLTTIKHGVTRFRITLECYEASCRSTVRRSQPSAPLAWITLTGLTDHPLSTTGRKIAQLLQSAARSVGRSSVTTLRPPLARSSTL